MQLLNQIQGFDVTAPLPERLLVVQQRFDAPQVADVAAATREALAQSELLKRVPAGATVAVGAGSRGVANIALMVRAVVGQLKEIGATPFVFPAMGSHGGATPDGQREILAELGVTEEFVGAPIRATMETVQIGQVPGGPPLFQDAYSAAADATLLVARIKPHTDFRSHIESGLAKMCVIGLGKHKGAIMMHALGTPNFQRFLEPAAKIYAQNTNLIGGIASLENAYDGTAEIVGLHAEEIGGPREARLLERAKSLMASLPFPTIDVLVVQRLGKNISGTGMDTNIIGRLMIPGQPENFGPPHIATIAVLDLTHETHGNASGIGLANVTTQRVASKIDWHATYTNAITAGIWGMQRSALPITMPDDRRALAVALRGCAQPQETARMVWMRDSLTLDHLWMSPSLQDDIQAHDRLEIVDETALDFAADGTMLSPWNMSA
jgi:hypothetical protein